MENLRKIMKCPDGYVYGNKKFDGFEVKAEVLVTDSNGIGTTKNIFTTQKERYRIQEYLDHLSSRTNEDAEVLRIHKK